MEVVYETPYHRITLGHDEACENPAGMRCDNDDVFLVGFDRNFWVTVDGFDRPEHVEDWEDTHDVFNLSAYIHSGVRLYLGSHRVCQWDSGQVGYVLVRKSTTPAVIGSAEWHEIFAAQQEYAKGLVEEWNQYLSGDVWWVGVQKKCGECGTWESADEFDCIGGVYGEEWARESAMTELKPQIQQRENEMVWETKDGYRATIENLNSLKRATSDPALQYVLREVIKGNQVPGRNTYETRVEHLRDLRYETEFVYTNEGQLRRFISRCGVQPHLDKWGNVSYYEPALNLISAAAGRILELTTNRNGVAI